MIFEEHNTEGKKDSPKNKKQKDEKQQCQSLKFKGQGWLHSQKRKFSSNFYNPHPFIFTPQSWKLISSISLFTPAKSTLVFIGFLCTLGPL